MDFVRNLQQKDWVIAAIAFIAGRDHLLKAIHRRGRTR